MGLNINVHSTPVAKEHGTIDYGQFTNSYKTEYRNGSFVHDLTNNIKFTVKSDGLVFGGPNILSDPLEQHTHSSWRQVNIWNVPDIAYKYEGDGISLHEEDLYGLSGKEHVFGLACDYGVPAVECAHKKRKLESDTEIGPERKCKCCLIQ